MAQVKPANKKKMSKPVLAATIVSIVILLGLVVSLLAGSGFFIRIQKGASSDNFTVNASMMSYYTNSVYQNWYEEWYNENYYYILLGYEQYLDFNPNVALDKQTHTATGKTYYEYFVDLTIDTVTTYLKYCEVAKADTTEGYSFKDLEKAANDYAKESLATISEAAKKQKVDTETYIRNYFGEHVNSDDLKKALVIEHIASDYYKIMYERIEDGITNEREDTFFKDNLESFVSAEYIFFTLSSTKTVEFPKAEDYVGGETSAAYKKAVEGKTAAQVLEAKINPADYEGGAESAAYKKALETAEANKKANEESLAKDNAVIEALKNAESEDAFKTIILEYKYDTTLESAYSTAVNKLGINDKLTTSVLKENKDADLQAAVIAAVLKGEENVDEALLKLDDLKKLFYGDKFSAHFDTAYNTAVKSLTDADKPSTDALNAYKESLKSAVVDALLNGKDDVDTTLVTLPEGASTKWTNAVNGLSKNVVKSLKESATKWIDAVKTIPATLITNLEKVITDSTNTAAYTLTSVLGNILFGGVKAEYGVDYKAHETQGTTAQVGAHGGYDVLAVNVENYKMLKADLEAQIAELDAKIAAETKADKKEDLEADKKTLSKTLDTVKENIKKAEEKLANVETTSEYSLTAYWVTESAHREDYKVRDVGHILFQVSSTDTTGKYYKTSSEAKAAAEKLLKDIEAAATNGVISKEKFEEFGKVTHDSNVFYENVAKGQMVEEFEDWLFAAETVGNFGLVETSYGWHIMYYGGEGEDVAWRLDAKTGATNEDMNTWFEGLEYEVNINKEIFDKIFK